MRCRFAITVLCTSIALGAQVLAQEAAPDIREYVRRPPSVDGVNGKASGSYGEISALYDSRVVPESIEMLNSKAEEPYWTQIAGVLGVVGDERAINALIAFVEKPVSEAHLSRAHQDARQQAIMSLGYLINKTGSERALTYLIDGLTPSEWRQRRVQGIAPWASSYEEYDLQLSKYALFGLALSGHPRAGEALRSLQQSPTAEQMQFRKGLDSTLTQWLEVHAQVAAQGVAGMYEHYENERRHQREAQLEEIERLRGPEARRLHEAQESPSEPQ